MTPPTHTHDFNRSSESSQPETVQERVNEQISALASAIEKILSSGSAERLSSRLRVAIEVASGSNSSTPP